MGALLLTPVYIMVNAYVAWWLLQYMGASHHLFKLPFTQGIIVLLYILIATTLLFGFLITKDPWHRILKVISNYWLGTFAYILSTVAIFDIIRIIGKKSRWLPETWFGSTTVFLRVGGIAIAIIICFSMLGIVQQRKLIVDERELVFQKTCKEKELTIALVADWHLGYSVGNWKIKQMVQKLNEIKPDLVCVAGDIFDNEYEAIEDPEQVAKTLRNIKSKYGVYAVFGNHDIREKILAGFTFPSNIEEDDPRFTQFLKSANMTLLNDKVICINDSFYLAGREDKERTQKFGSKRKTPVELLQGIDKTKPVIVLDHQPKELEKLAQAGADMMLSGHTHDGQIFPADFVTSFFWENSDGILKKGEMYSCVTSGIGIWGPNMRLGTDSEIMVLHLKFK